MRMYPPFLAAVYYDRFELRGWTRTAGARSDTAGGDADILAGTAEAVTADGRRTPITTIKPTFSRSEVFSPGLPTSISSPVQLNLTAPGGYLAVSAASGAPLRIP